MNNIAIQKRTNFQTVFPAIVALIRSLLPVIILLLAWVSLKPFPVFDANALPTGSLVNQVAFTGLCALSLAIVVMAVDWRVASSMISVPWIILIIALIASGIGAPVPDVAVRAIAFTIIAFLMVAPFFAMPPDADSLSLTLIVGCLVVLGLCYMGVVVLPARAIHQASELESQHSGFWRGLYSHKNITGPMMTAIGYAGIYLFRRKYRFTGALIAIAGFVFLAKTGSKTSLALAPAVALAIMFCSSMGMRKLAAVTLVFMCLVAHAFTVGTVFSPTLNSILRAISETTTFTGRIEIWEFARPYILANPWTGLGYDGFWGSAIALSGDQPFDRAWDPRLIVHGHNGYLDAALIMGIPMMLVLVWATLISPALNYMRVSDRTENVLLADFLFMIVIFTVTNSALESYFFRRDDPVWLTLVMAIFGLRFVSRFPITRHS